MHFEQWPMHLEQNPMFLLQPLLELFTLKSVKENKKPLGQLYQFESTSNIFCALFRQSVIVNQIQFVLRAFQK